MGAPFSPSVVAIGLGAVFGGFLLLAAIALARVLRQVRSPTAERRKGARRDPALDSLDARLQASLRAQIYLDPTLDLPRLARALDAPPKLVSRLINQRHGTNVAGFLNHQRVAVAAERLLAEPEASIKTVMYDAGFLSKSRFNGAFHRQMGVSPSEYRRRELASRT